jgi:hypothetical protein
MDTYMHAYMHTCFFCVTHTHTLTHTHTHTLTLSLSHTHTVVALTGGDAGGRLRAQEARTQHGVDTLCRLCPRTQHAVEGLCRV